MDSLIYSRRVIIDDPIVPPILLLHDLIILDTPHPLRLLLRTTPNGMGVLDSVIPAIFGRLRSTHDGGSLLRRGGVVLSMGDDGHFIGVLFLSLRLGHALPALEYLAHTQQFLACPMFLHLFGMLVVITSSHYN